jgi:hypothetical protein
MGVPDQDDAHSPYKTTAFCRSGGGGHRTGHRSVDQQAKSDELAIKRQATWGMSAETEFSDLAKLILQL